MRADLDPWAFQRWAYQTRVGSPSRKAVLMVLAVMVDTNTGRCEAREETLWQACEMGETTIRGHLRELERAGLVARRAQRRVDGSRRANEYLLLAPWIAEWPDGELVQVPLQPADAAGCDQPADPAGCSPSTGSSAHLQPAAELTCNRQPAAGQERPPGRPPTGDDQNDQENDQVEELSEARARALDSVADDLSESETQAVEGLTWLLSERGAELTGRQRSAIVAAGRAAVGVDLAAAVKRLERFYGPDGAGQHRPINDIVALLVTEMARSAPKPKPAAAKKFEFKGKSSRQRQAQPLGAVASAPAEGLPADLQAAGPGLLEAWQRIRDQLRATTTESTWSIWLAPLRIAGYTTGLVTELDDDAERPLRTVYLATSPEQIAWIDTRFTRLIHEAVAAELGDEVPVRVVAVDEARVAQPAREEAA